jgi:hypothetical protein
MMALLHLICSFQLSAKVLAASEPDANHLVEQFIRCQQTQTVHCSKYRSILMNTMQITEPQHLEQNTSKHSK